MSVAIDFQHISKKFGATKALNDVSFSVPDGAFWGLLGPNGAGKTTLINILAGLCVPDFGSAHILGHNVQSDPLNARSNIGIVPQELIYDPFFSVRENLRFQSYYYGLWKNDKWIDELLDELNLSEKADTNTRQLSGGMKRRLLIAQALVHKPRVVVLDEPTAGVDVNLRQALWKFIRKMNKSGHTILLTTHYLEEAENLCDQIVMMKDGEILMVEETEKLLKNHTIIATVKISTDRIPKKWESVTERSSTETGTFHFQLEDYASLESLLTDIRNEGNQIAEIEISPPGLETVFQRIINASY